MTRRIIAAACCAALLVVFGCDSKAGTSSKGKADSKSVESTGLKELVKTDVKVGTGELTVAEGDTVSVTYTGKLKNGTIFDSNDKPEGSPFTFVVGAQSVIKGWDIGVVGMKVGGVRKLDVPTKLAYATQPPPGSNVPPNSDLYFEVKVLDLIKKGDENVYDKKDLKVGSGKAAAMGSTVTVHYKATLVNGRRIDSTYERKKSETFKLGAGDVIKGFEYGLVGMKVGGKRWLRIPPNIGYGSYGMNNVPANSTVLFEVELLKVQ